MWVSYFHSPVFFCILIGKLLIRAAVHEELVIVIREYVHCVLPLLCLLGIDCLYCWK